MDDEMRFSRKYVLARARAAATESERLRAETRALFDAPRLAAEARARATARRDLGVIAAVLALVAALVWMLG